MFTLTVIQPNAKDELRARWEAKQKHIAHEAKVRKAYLRTSKQDGTVAERRALAESMVAGGCIR